MSVVVYGVGSPPLSHASETGFPESSGGLSSRECSRASAPAFPSAFALVTRTASYATAGAAHRAASTFTSMLELGERDRVSVINDLVAARLNGWPASYPECLTHEAAHVCRFLQGHGHEPTKAAEKMIAAVEVRHSRDRTPWYLSRNPSVRGISDRTGLTVMPSRSAVPHAEDEGAGHR